MAKEIFISYSRKDFDKVKAIKDELDRELGIKCWMDLDGIESGEQFENKIISAIKDHDTMLFMLSANSMNSIYALKELKFAQLKKKRVILVYIESCQMSDEFLFNYSMYDTVEWANSLQHNKLLNNLQEIRNKIYAHSDFSFNTTKVDKFGDNLLKFKDLEDLEVYLKIIIDACLEINSKHKNGELGINHIPLYK